jgi:hypothetical protein
MSIILNIRLIEFRSPHFSLFLLSGTSTAGNIRQLGNVEHTPGAPPAGFHFIGYQCTKKSCERVFATHPIIS